MNCADRAAPPLGRQGCAKAATTLSSYNVGVLEGPMEETMTTSTQAMSRPAVRAQRANVLVEPEWLAARLSDENVRVVEVDVSSAAYESWHIDGAVLWNVYQDFKDPDYRLAGPE